MIKSEIRAALEALKTIRMPKIEDRGLRNDLIDNHFVLLEVGRKTEEKLADTRKVCFSPYEEDQAKLEELQKEYNGAESESDRRRIIREMNSFTEYNKAQREYYKLVESVNQEEVEGLKRIDRKKFMEEIQKQDYSLEWIEALYPLFVLEETKKPKNSK